MIECVVKQALEFKLTEIDTERWLITQLKKVFAIMSDSAPAAKSMRNFFEKMIKERTGNEDHKLIQLDCGMHIVLNVEKKAFSTFTMGKDFLAKVTEALATSYGSANCLIEKNNLQLFSNLFVTLKYKYYRGDHIAECANKTYAISRFLATNSCEILSVPISSNFL